MTERPSHRTCRHKAGAPSPASGKLTPLAPDKARSAARQGNGIFPTKELSERTTILPARSAGRPDRNRHGSHGATAHARLVEPLPPPSRPLQFAEIDRPGRLDQRKLVQIAPDIAAGPLRQQRRAGATNVQIIEVTGDRRLFLPLRRTVGHRAASQRKTTVA